MDAQELQRLKNKYDLIGNDAALNRALETAVAVAPTDLTVLVKGRLDTLTSPQLESELEPSIAKSKSLVLDLSDVDYLSSAGLRLLLTLQKRFKKEGGSFVLRNIQPGVMEILRMTGFLKILSVQ